MDNIITLRESALKQIKAAKTTKQLKNIEKEYVGKTGSVSVLFTKIKDMESSKRADFGQSINTAKTAIESAIETKLTQLRQEQIEKSLASYRIDPTAPFDVNSGHKVSHIDKSGTQHPLVAEAEKMFKILETMGYVVEERRILTDDWNCFESLNIPKGHPARDMWDTFWTEDGYIPSAHTSSQQVQYLKKYKKNLSKGKPVAVVIPGGCFRNEATDATHEMTFFQIEMLYISDKATIGDLIGTMKEFLKAYFEKEDIKIQVQPSYFPFVEPGLQFMNGCVFCNGVGCSICKFTGWIELMGCGYVHPRVIENAGLDSDKYSGYAYGVGVERLVILKNAIEDIRNFRSGDIGFLRQFGN